MEAAARTAGVTEADKLAPPAFAAELRPGREALLAAPVRWPQPAALEAPLTSLRRAGERMAALAREQLGLRTLDDLLRHLPHSHRDSAGVTDSSRLRLGETATLLVEVRRARVRPTRRRRLKIVEAEVFDSGGPLTAIWFNRAWLGERLAPGTRALVRGRLEKRGFVVDSQELLGDGARAAAGGNRSARGVLGRPGDQPPAGIHTTGLIPVHPASEGVRAHRIREWAWQVAGLATDAVESLPAPLRVRERLPGAADALVAAHFPAGHDEVAVARRRLAFEELLLYQAALAERRRRRCSSRSARALPPPGELVGRWLAALPFELTADQRRAIDEIGADLERDEPMQRLLMGEVGSGKTVVALEAMLRAAGCGRQAALMAPTETLAEQHFRTLEVLLGPVPLPIALLTGSTSAAARRDSLDRLASGELPLVVGTHALIEDAVAFSDLALVVIDEQHRFGVRQRAALDAKARGNRAPHALHMTATPIPRTLSLTAYGDLDATELRELPPGRRPVRTWVAAGDERADAYDFLRARLREGRQAYVVCPLVSESEALQAKAATEEAAELAAGELREFELEVMHGQMPSAGKGRAMERFASGAADVLVATSVIEVGIDVPNATVMVVEAAERYGLSQLHQLRGRVGRGGHESTCIMFGDARSQTARARLEAIASERDGFKLAEIDLSIRGEGELLGTRQHGLPRLRAAVLPDDAELLLSARRALGALLAEHGSLDAAALGPLLDEARRRFGDERVQRIAA